MTERGKANAVEKNSCAVAETGSSDWECGYTAVIWKESYCILQRSDRERGRASLQNFDREKESSATDQ